MSLQFGEYKFPGAWKFQTRSKRVANFSPQMPAVEGTFVANFYLRETTMKVQGLVGGGGQYDSEGQPYITLDDVVQEINRLDAALCLGYGIFGGGFTDGRYIIAQKNKLSVKPLPASGRTMLQVDLELFIPDGRWLSAFVSVAQFDSSGNWQTGDGGTIGSPYLAVEGSAIAYPQVTLTGPHSGPFTFGVKFRKKWKPWYRAGDSITISCSALNLSASDTFVIDCDPANRHHAFLLNGDARNGWLTWGPSIGGTNTYNEDAYFPYFVPTQLFQNFVVDSESDPLQIILTGAPASGAVIRWQNAFLA